VPCCLPAHRLGDLPVAIVVKKRASRYRLGRDAATEVRPMLKVFCARSMHVAVRALADDFAGGAAADIVFEPMGALQARLAAGETADVLILATSAIDALGAQGKIAAASRADVGRAPIGVAVRAGSAAVPDIATPQAFAATLTAARAIALSDPAVGGSAGIYLRDLFAKLGLAEMIAAKTAYQKSGVAAAAAVARGDADLAMTFVPELLQADGVRILGPLPPPYGHETAYTAAVAADSRHRDDALAFIAALTAPGARTVFAKAGFAPAG
jgi:molybdate transport system substrate-binding protein